MRPVHNDDADQFGRKTELWHEHGHKPIAVPPLMAFEAAVRNVDISHVVYPRGFSITKPGTGAQQKRDRMGPPIFSNLNEALACRPEVACWKINVMYADKNLCGCLMRGSGVAGL